MLITCVSCNRDATSGYIFKTGYQTFEAFTVCLQCVTDADSPGKFEGMRHNRKMLALTVGLHSVSMDSSWLDSDYSDSLGWHGRSGRFVFTEDTYGFWSCQELLSADIAEKTFNAAMELADFGDCE